MKWLGFPADCGHNIQRMMLDTGCAPHNLLTTSNNADLKNSTESSTQFRAAFGQTTRGDKDGILDATVLGQNSYSTVVPIAVTSVPGLNENLGSYYWWYQQGYDLIVNLDNPHMEHRETAQKIPLFFDSKTKGWYIVFHTSEDSASDRQFCNFIEYYRQIDAPKLQQYKQYLEERQSTWASCCDDGELESFVNALSIVELQQLDQQIDGTEGYRAFVATQRALRLAIA
jgi:hypothetical protein